MCVIPTLSSLSQSRCNHYGKIDVLRWDCFRKKNYAIDGCRKKHRKVYMPKVGDTPVTIFVTKKKIFMNAIQILGLVAGALTTAAFLPQVIKTWKSRSAKDLSLGMFSLFCLGVAMWLVYGF